MDSSEAVARTLSSSPHRDRKASEASVDQQQTKQSDKDTDSADKTNGDAAKEEGKDDKKEGDKKEGEKDEDKKEGEAVEKNEDGNRRRRGRGRGRFRGNRGGYFREQYYPDYYYEPVYYGLPSPPFKNNFAHSGNRNENDDGNGVRTNNGKSRREKQDEHRDRPGFFAARTYRSGNRKSSEKGEVTGETVPKEVKEVKEANGSALDSAGEKVEGAEGQAEAKKRRRRRKKRAQNQRQNLNDGYQPEYIDQRFMGNEQYSPRFSYQQQFQQYGYVQTHQQPQRNNGNYQQMSPEFHQQKPRFLPTVYQGPDPRYGNGNGYDDQQQYNGNNRQQQQHPQGRSTGFYDNFGGGQGGGQGGGRPQTAKRGGKGPRAQLPTRAGFNPRLRHDTDVSQQSDGNRPRTESRNSQGGKGIKVPIVINNGQSYGYGI